MDRNVTICRPGFGASCSLCCGSHNYRASREEIGELFGRRAGILRDYSSDFLKRRISSWRSRMTGSYYADDSDPVFSCTLPALFQDCLRCPFVGFIGEGNNNIGCLACGDADPAGLRHECFLSYRGKVFTCPAREALRDDEILYAARLTGDWYYYSILIHEPELLRLSLEEYPVPEEVPPAQRGNLYRDLEERIVRRRELHAIHGYFS